jgi:hypothetical protein
MVDLLENKYKDLIQTVDNHLGDWYRPWIEQQAKEKLIKAGRKAVPSLIVALEYSEEWLGQTRESIKKNPDEDHLTWQEGHFVAFSNCVSSMLGEITGENFGNDLRSWKEWWEQEKG